MTAPTFRSRFGQPSSRWPMPGADRVVDRRVAQRALDADGAQTARPLAPGRDADDGIGVEQRQRHRRILQVDAALPDRLQHGRGQGVGVDLQPDARARPPG